MPRLVTLTLLAALPLGARAEEPGEFFEKRVRPVLVEHCYACHSAKANEPKSGLRLDSRSAVLKGGARGPAVVPGDVAKSRLLHAISYSNVDLSMPPRGKLPAQAIADLTAWVKMGAPWPGGEAVVVEKKPGFDLQKRKAEHWAWQPVKPLPPPAVRDTAWPLTPADRFILAKLEAAGLRPALPADRATWLRRVYFDLIGLPPTVAEIEQFERDASATPQAAMTRVVDRLLASPHFGERWGRHWLDLVRYAETKGHEFDAIIPNAYQYRDYVIRALNADVPYNQFVTEHIAGDLLPKPRLSGPDGFNESILGTGFWFLGEEVHSPVDIRADECDRIDNKIDVFSKTFLALTVSCARCHDHKFDAISQKDYYALSGFLSSSSYQQVRFDTIEHHKRIANELAELRDRHRKTVWKALAASIKPVVETLAKNLLAARAAIRAGKVGDTSEVQAWVKYLNNAAKDPTDPFHVWATLAPLKDDEAEQRLATIVRDHSVRIKEKPKESWEIPFLSDSQLSEAGITADGVCWGTLEQPIRRFRRFSELQFDPFFARSSLVAGTESDHGALGAKPRSQILRTMEVTLHFSRVYFFVRGRGRVYAAVDSHALIAGPLHGRLIKEFDTAGKWQWIEWDLTPYKGHRYHLEFSTDDPNFALDLCDIAEADSTPSSAKPETIPWGTFRLKSIEDLAAMYQSMLGTLATAGDFGLDETRLLDFARSLANCVLNHPELFGIKDFAKLRAAAAPLIEGQQRLAKQLRTQSRLAPAMCDVGKSNEHVLIRGSHKSPGEEVSRRFLEALAGPRGIESDGSGRLELVRQVTDHAVNPLIARVIVNRVWHHLFGRGIVASVDNFGVMGDRPTHPELLDFLADRFVKEGWSLKRLIRELVLSQTYRMASRGDAEPADPENKLLHAMRLKRLEGEVIRDSMLALAGRLDATMFGKPVPIYLGNIAEARGKPPVDGPLDGAGRRSVYVAVRRNFLSPFMLAFDTPAPFSTMGRRTTSNVPAQALILMNDPFVHQQAERWGRRLAAEPGDVAGRVERMYQSAFARRPTAAELARSRAFIEQGGAWGDVAHVLFNVKEFIYIP